jgi:hypothetical protein
LHPRRE